MNNLKNKDFGTFKNLIESSLGLKIWAFLNEHDNIIRMETASELKRPAVEAIAPFFVEKFRDLLPQDKYELRKYKQMIGVMVREIMMKDLGYTKKIKSPLKIADRYDGNKEPDKQFFSRGTRYEKER
ncbi:MAG: hypothetical protein ACK5MJ_02660 [Alphaproteobacteria bacterium]